jgi:hypothetical protein
VEKQRKNRERVGNEKREGKNKGKQEEKTGERKKRRRGT